METGGALFLGQMTFAGCKQIVYGHYRGNLEVEFMLL